MNRIWSLLVVAALIGVLGAREAGWLREESAQSLAAAPGVGSATSESPIPALSVHAPAPSAGTESPAAEDLRPGTGRPIPATALAVLLGNASSSQRPALEDGSITLDERNAALLRAQQCTIDGTRDLTGVSVNEPIDSISGELSFGGYTAPSKALLEEASGVHLSCVFEHYREVAAAWTSAAAEIRLQSLWEAMSACMRTAGANPPGNANWEDLLATSRTHGGDRVLYDRCHREAEAK